MTGVHLDVELRGAMAMFTTRHGGVSEGPFASLNLSLRTGDDMDAARENRRRVAEWARAAFAEGRQVHGSVVARVTEFPAQGLYEADGQATALKGVAPIALVADCLPIALAGEGGVAMVHAGWRGLAAGVIAEGVVALGEVGATGELHAVIGPGAGPCCYEVDDELRSRFPDAARGRNLDLKAIAAAQLKEAGVEHVQDVGLCTICHPELFFSHRREQGPTGRQAGIVWRT